MILKLPDQIQNIARQFSENNYQFYLVGGAVRNFLLNRLITDWDFTTDATPEQILEIFPNGHYNNKFGTVGITTTDHPLLTTETQQTHDSRLMTHDSVIEITTMRQEGEYKDSRHPEKIAWTNDILVDLKRRDFTINALALKIIDVKDDKNISSPDIIDPFGGKQDLDKKLIKAVGEPDKRFSEDALRLIRAIRFATQLQFKIEKQTFDSIIKNTPLIQQIAWERIRDELLKVLATEEPLQGMLLLRSAGLLHYILPELEKCFGIMQEGPKHDRSYDIGEHSFLSLKFCPSNDPIVRFAALIHDIGKPNTFKKSPSGNATFYNHEVVGAKIAEAISRRFNFSKPQKELIVKLVRWHLFTVDENQTDSAIRRFINNIGIDNLDSMWAIREADRLGGGTQTPTSWRHEHFKQRIKQVLIKPFSVSDLKIDGNDIMKTLNIPPSRKVGEILNELFEEISQDQTKNTYDYLINRLKNLSG